MADAETANHDLKVLLQEATKGAPRGVYLLIGEPADTATAARALIDIVVPEARRSFNLELYEGRTTAIGRVVDTVRTPGFFAGVKLVWVKESGVFLSAEKKGDVATAMLAAAEDGREQEAAEKLLTLAALAGWDEEKLRQTDWRSAPKTRLKDVFGEGVDDGDRDALERIQSAAFSRELRLAAFQDEASVLAELIEEGIPGNLVLLFTASTVDSRKRVVKLIRDKGALVDLSAERERSGALTRATIEQVIQRVAQSHGKRIDSAARELLARRAGPEASLLAGEVEKLCLYVGEREAVSESDARLVVRDMAESWVFDLTAALAARDAAKALPVLRGLFEQGEPPLRLIGMIARELRLLLVARECLESSLRGKWSQGLRFDAFQTRVLPAIDEGTRGAFGNAHPFVLFRRFQDAQKIDARSLRQALVDLAGLDLRLKSAPNDPAMLVEVFLLRWCGLGRKRRTVAVATRG